MSILAYHHINKNTTLTWKRKRTHTHTQHTPPKMQTNNKTPLTKTSHARDTPTSKTNTPPATYHLLVEEHITEQMRRAKCKSLALESVPTARASSIESRVLEPCEAVWLCDSTRACAFQILNKLCIRTTRIGDQSPATPCTLRIHVVDLMFCMLAGTSTNWSI